MAALETTVSSPHGEILSLPGRVPRGRALDEARERTQKSIMLLQAHLRELDNWDVKTHRGSTQVLSYEELEARK